MDPLEDEFDRILRENPIPDDFLRAADTLEVVALGPSCSPTANAPTQAFEADNFDLMFIDDLSDDLLVACDEAERSALLPGNVLDGELVGSSPQVLHCLRDSPPHHPNDIDMSTPDTNGVLLPPLRESSPEEDEFDILLSDSLADDVLLAYDQAERVGFLDPLIPTPPQAITGSACSAEEHLAPERTSRNPSCAFYDPTIV
ncbi:hypothetical protein C8R44DRAFT_252421 [Mycena epipterygia]|nr:hypothetical protein C8R44DRAFT_252421 [Mycena epipterygia]